MGSERDYVSAEQILTQASGSPALSLISSRALSINLSVNRGHSAVHDLCDFDRKSGTAIAKTVDFSRVDRLRSHSFEKLGSRKSERGFCRNGV
jgi:hypothetical protein